MCQYKKLKSQRARSELYFSFQSPCHLPVPVEPPGEPAEETGKVPSAKQKPNMNINR